MAGVFHIVGDAKLRKKITVAELESVPEEYRICYMDTDDGDLELSVRAADAVVEAKAEIVRLSAQVEKLETEYPAKLEAEKKARRDDAVENALHSSLSKARIKPGLFEGAMALLKRENEFEVELSDDGKKLFVNARTPLGLQSVDTIVARLVEGEEGAAWRGKPSAPSAGFFS
ncbi:hypothetical protein, partial [Mesorhizobium sp. B2-4-17]|uniref:hypothetical protein n=1 Tax=Mesorhizobium sp. B2-4-17 TaxID=2589932 RepID=UPI0011292D74